MSDELILTQQQARRIAVRAQLLDARRPADPIATVRGLFSISADHTPYLADNLAVVLWSRLGASFDATELAAALAAHRIVSLYGLWRVADDLALYAAEQAAWPVDESSPYVLAGAGWVEANGQARAEVLEQLAEAGPLPARAISARFERPWRSSGWNNDKNVTMLLARLEERGEAMVAGYRDRAPLWDLAERVVPDVRALPIGDAVAERDRRRLAATGIARRSRRRTPSEDVDYTAVGVPARVEGLCGVWSVDENLLAGDFEPRTALLSPLDGLVYDRRRLRELFGFDFALEMYKPAGQRRFGYWALPVLDGDSFVGAVDAERVGDDLIVHGITRTEPWSPALAARVDAELVSLAAALNLRAP